MMDVHAVGLHFPENEKKIVENLLVQRFLIIRKNKTCATTVFDRKSSGTFFDVIAKILAFAQRVCNFDTATHDLSKLEDSSTKKTCDTIFYYYEKLTTTEVNFGRFISVNVTKPPKDVKPTKLSKSITSMHKGKLMRIECSPWLFDFSICLYYLAHSSNDLTNLKLLLDKCTDELGGWNETSISYKSLKESLYEEIGFGGANVPVIKCTLYSVSALQNILITI